MNALILNGSPRPKGSVAKILKEVSDKLTHKFEVDLVDVYKLDVKPCIGCRGCRKNDTECVLKEDDAQIIGRKMKETDLLVVGSPTHFNNMSSPLKALLDRNGTTLFEETSFIPVPKHKGKPAIIVTACMSPTFFSFIFGMTRGVFKNIKVYLKYGGFKIVGKLAKTGTSKTTDLGAPLLKKIERMTRRLEKSVSVS